MVMAGRVPATRSGTNIRPRAHQAEPMRGCRIRRQHAATGGRDTPGHDGDLDAVAPVLTHMGLDPAISANRHERPVESTIIL